jgi:hypothetical protein
MKVGCAVGCVDGSSSISENPPKQITGKATKKLTIWKFTLGDVRQKIDGNITTRWSLPCCLNIGKYNNKAQKTNPQISEQLADLLRTMFGLEATH